MILGLFIPGTKPALDFTLPWHTQQVTKFFQAQRQGKVRMRISECFDSPPMLPDSILMLHTDHTARHLGYTR